MPFPGLGYSLGDVIKALQVAHWIQEKCFTPINSASSLYRQFQQDVAGLEQRVTQFQEAFGAAAEQAAEDPSDLESLQREWALLARDFRMTLEDCEKLLKRYSKFEHGRATALDNGFWNARTQPRVEELRRRLQFHSCKIDFLVKHIAIKMSTLTQTDISEILAILKSRGYVSLPDNPLPETPLPDIPLSVETSLKSALFRDSPVQFDGPEEIPLEQGVEALSFHYEDSTARLMSVGPDIKQKLGLLKAHWLFSLLKSSSTLTHSRPGSLYPRTVEKIGKDIKRQYAGLSIRHWAEDDFLGLDDDAWTIWPVKEISKATDPGEVGKKIVEAPLVDEVRERKKTLTISRVDDGFLRIALSQVTKATSASPQVIERNTTVVKLGEVGLVPIYAESRSNGNRFRLNVTNWRGASSESYEFESVEDALRVQNAFTGYNALPPQILDGDLLPASTRVTCIVTYRKKGLISVSEQDTAIGEAQIWRPLLPRRHSIGSPLHREVSPTSSQRRTYAESQLSLASEAFRTYDPSVVAVTRQEDDREVVVASTPLAPLLVFIGHGKTRYTIWKTNLSQLSIQQEHRYVGKKCRSLIQNESGKKFLIQRLSVPKEQQESWNLCAISTVGPQDLKNKPGSKVETLYGSTILVDFRNEQEQDDYHLCFKFAKGELIRHHQQFRSSLHVAGLQEQTQLRRRSLPVIWGRRPSDSQCEASDTPRLNPIVPLLPLFEDDAYLRELAA